MTKQGDDDPQETTKVESSDIIKDRIEFARSISTNSLQHIGFIDTKTTIIVAINGVLLGLLLGSSSINSHAPEEPWYRYVFMLVVSLFGASAVFGLVTIIPRIARNARYAGSLTFHETILGRKPYDDIQIRIANMWDKNKEALDNTAFEKFKDKFDSICCNEILEQEVLNAYRLAGALSHQFLWVRLSLTFLIIAIILLSFILFIGIGKSTR